MADRKNAFTAEPVNELINRTRRFPEFQEMAGYLGGAMPQFRYGSGAEMMGSSGQYDPRTNRIALAERFAYGVNPGQAEETVVHELTHAAMDKMRWAYQNAKKNRGKDPAASQFADAYEKLVMSPDFVSQTSAVANRMAPGWAASKNAYRASGAELPAWGMGLSATGRADDYESPLHLNPTLATEFRVLLDLANRIKK
jgi:hypothetical protein